MKTPMQIAEAARESAWKACDKLVYVYEKMFSYEQMNAAKVCADAVRNLDLSAIVGEIGTANSGEQINLPELPKPSMYALDGEGYPSVGMYNYKQMEAYALAAVALSQVPQAVQPSIASAIKYPEEWDAAAYPTLESALDELAAWHKVSKQASQPTGELRLMDQKAFAFDEWIEKTNWVQEQISTFPPTALGKHRADVMREEIERLRISSRSSGEWNAAVEAAIEMAQRFGPLTIEELESLKRQPSEVSEHGDKEAFIQWVTTIWRPDDGAELLKREWPHFAFAAFQAGRNNPLLSCIAPQAASSTAVPEGWRESLAPVIECLEEDVELYDRLGHNSTAEGRRALAHEISTMIAASPSQVQAAEQKAAQPAPVPFAYFQKHPISGIWEEVNASSAGQPGVVAAYLPPPQAQQESKDAERLDWLIKNCGCDEVEMIGPLPYPLSAEEFLKEAKSRIDAAIAQSKGGEQT